MHTTNRRCISDDGVIRVSNVIPEIGERVPLEFRRLVQKSWDKHSKARPNAEQVAFTLLKYTLDVCADLSQQNEPVNQKKELSTIWFSFEVSMHELRCVHPLSAFFHIHICQLAKAIQRPKSDPLQRQYAKVPIIYRLVRRLLPLLRLLCRVPRRHPSLLSRMRVGTRTSRSAWPKLW